ncbi:MAG TPA: neutral/alkaline non-lysosomal ceramidase N-terminal domain-containing protein [Acidimicrobiales bacterium]|nr:neutral/alkaline non-lysosomal ceramidase N-terminal domain-containing protein [Acidimicrobiales bacterium]
MAAGWDIAADSPLLPFVDGRVRRARFTVDDPVAAGSPPPLPRGTGLLAGATEVDITPPPGMPKAGYSRNAKTGTGFRSRLRARVLHLRSPSGSLVLVQCDLLGGSAVVQRLVARAVAERTDVPAAGVYIGATHTHGGPGQFLGTDFYNRFASNKTGFDPAWTQFLAERIAGGVVAAVAHRRPARLAVGETDVWGLTRNRSLDSHVRNAEVTDRRTERQRSYVSIDPCLHLVRVDAEAPAGGFEPLAATVVFAVHGTGVPMHADHYNADLWAYVVGELAARIEHRHGVRPVVGAVEGPHADVAPSLHPGRAGHLEARRIGAGIGAAAAELYERLEGSLTERVELACGLRELDLDRNRTSGGVTLSRRAAVGGALLGGAFENETPVLHRIPPFKAGMPRRRPHGAQGVKWVIGGSLQALVLPPRSFPRVLPVQVLRIADVALVGLPFELTVETGRRVGAAVLAAIGADGVADVERTIVTSVANEYAGYCTTPEEYGLQRYEGGHTLYGPGTQPFVTAEAARLAAQTMRAGLVTDLVPGRRFDLRVRRYLPARAGATGRPAGGAAGLGAGAVRSVAGAAAFVDATATTDPRWELEWLDVAPADLDWHEPLLRVEMADGAGVWRPAVAHGRPVDDQGCDIEVVHAGATPEGAHRYVTRWWDPGFKAGRRHRFVLVPNAGQPEVASSGFD